MSGQWLQPDHSLGDANTIGGYMRVHARPAAFEGPDGLSYSVAIDGVWQNEQPLTANAKSRLLPPYGRVAYEGVLAVPNGAQKLEVYFHVKTFLVVDYDKFSNVGERRYAQGARLLVREKWDNEHGAYADNYDFTTASK